MAYLDDHPPRLRQFRDRGTTASGVIVVHTAESALDTIGADTGAEGVAAFIASRTNYGSYHWLVDSDSIINVVRMDQQAYGDGTGSNPHAIHVSFACRAADWPHMSAERKAAFIRNGAIAAKKGSDYVHSIHGVHVPAKRITRAQSDQRVEGFISHGGRDPGRRTDPGSAFPWDLFLSTYAELNQGDDMPNYRDWTDADKKALAEDVAEATVDALMTYEVIPRKDVNFRDAVRHGSAKKAAKGDEGEK